MITCNNCSKSLSDETPLDLFECIHCGEFALDDDGPLYECGTCGNVYTRGSTSGDNHICDKCHKFGMKMAEHGCSNCKTGELQVVTGYECPNCWEFVIGEAV